MQNDPSSLGVLLFPGPLNAEQKQRLHDEAEAMLGLLIELVDPVPPEQFRNVTEWKIDHLNRARFMVLRIRG